MFTLNDIQNSTLHIQYSPKDTIDSQEVSKSIQKSCALNIIPHSFWKSFLLLEWVPHTFCIQMNLTKNQFMILILPVTSTYFTLLNCRIASVIKKTEQEVQRFMEIAEHVPCFFETDKCCRDG